MTQPLKHTPTPWIIRTLGKDCFIECPKEKLGKAYGQEIMADDYFPELNKLADAQHIVKCVNSHDELVEACKTLLIFAKACRHNEQGHQTWNESDENDFTQAVQALKSAGEEV